MSGKEKRRKPTGANPLAQQSLLSFLIASNDLEYIGNSGVIVELVPENTEKIGTLADDAMRLEDAADSINAPEFDPYSPEGGGRSEGERRLLYLLGAHRVLAEQIVAANRKLASSATLDNIDSKEIRAVRDRLNVFRAQRAELDVSIEEQLKAIKAQQRKEVRTATPATDGQQAQGGLVKVRHPNRDFFLADLFDYALKDDGASMEAPIFTLATKPDLSIWEWTSRDGNRAVKVTPSVLGRATQHDKDILIYVVSQMTEGLNRGRGDAKNRTVRFTVYDYLVTTNRGVGGDDYRRLQESFDRLAGTRIKTNIRTGGERVSDNFGILDRVRIVEKSQDDERMIAVEVTLSEWLYNAVQAYEVLTIHPDYFRLRKPLARRCPSIALSSTMTTP